ncbi:hypothetical protein H6G89_30925 [Oscillatoria sp. FACHB-1407]|uniref:SGNH/GDSL hydrolase family protein n=1 Tax=Oscillatoria sp. FACHB-1407 TaxID=2692847 RepID=UPI0016840CFB|nr:SGNH/GDSL hydrolase family protein [Oscillatoria sp. FACHB-1407]MBD2465424.1 hypothetical protein [Oscillatoria sp. FACHB-1407]
MPAKLVVIGDSLSQGFISGSICKTDFSYPQMLADCLGIQDFRVPDFGGEGGLPLNLDQLFRLLARRYGAKVSWLEVPMALLSVRSFMDRVEDYWERGEGSEASPTGPLHHNLAVWGFELGDCDTLTEAICRRTIPRDKDDLLNQIPEFAMYRTARRTLNPQFLPQYEELSQIKAAEAIARSQGGIDNLMFWLGGNNCLGTVGRLKIVWSQLADINRLSHERSATLWVPEHFRQLLRRVADKISAIGAKNVFIGTIPHVTIPPVSRGISPGRTPDRERSADGYYDYYTHFWVWDNDFAKAPDQYPALTQNDARQIDQVIDEYNEAIATEAQKRGWHVVDFCRALDRLAYRRQNGRPVYVFPPELVQALKTNPGTQDRFTVDGKPILDTRYLRVKSDAPPGERHQGGIFSLDGIHPTTVGYGIVAHEVLQVMKSVTPGQIVKPLDWNKIVAADVLLNDLPANLESLRDILGFLSSQGPLPNLIRSITGGFGVNQ